MRKLFTAGLMFACTSLAWAAEAGRVVFVTGQVQLASRAATVDAAVNEGDELSTGPDGAVYIKTVDNGFLILRANSKARVAAYHIDQKNPANTRVKLELSQGVARAISGQGVKAARQNFRFNTPVAAIGVRGTDFTVFTDQLTSRVSVTSGGVIVAGFSGSCTAEGAGPCEGSASRELFAGQAGLLQIQRGQHMPQLLNNPALSPDQTEKPRSDEPVGKASVTTLSPAQVNLEPQRTEASLVAIRASVNTPTDGGNNGGNNGGTGNPIVTPPPVVGVDPGIDTPPPVPKAQEVFWGRWAAIAGDAVKPASFTGKDLDSPAFVDGYMIARTKNAPLVMPKEGTIAFTLTNSEAYMQRGTVETAAKVDSGTLGINFNDRTFTTALVVSDATTSVNVNGRGVIDNKGLMSNSAGSPTAIRGYLSGAQAEEAAYVFRNTSKPGVTVIGGTTWKK